MANDHVLADGRHALLTYQVGGSGAEAGSSGAPTAVSPVLGLSATFSGIITINTTGAVVVAANANRTLGVWIQCNEGTNGMQVGDSLATASVYVHRGITTATPTPLFIPGQGAIYARAKANFSEFIGYAI